jgi:hypothetical protein
LLGILLVTAIYLFFLKFAVRFKERLFDWRPSEPIVPSRSLNAVVYVFSRLVQMVFKFMPLPFGSSLLVVGGKNHDH